MLCIHACKHNNAETYIKANDTRIESTNKLRILGFEFDNRPNANKHVESFIERFYQKLWTLRFLKRSGLKEDDLLALYNCSVRSAVEYCSTVYHSMIPGYLTAKLESVQRQALKIIYGWTRDIDEIMAIKSIETLEERREKALLNFALKNEHVGKYGKRWFTEEDVPKRSTRTTRNKYKIPRGRTNRSRANPITYMAMRLNEHYKQ